MSPESKRTARVVAIGLVLLAVLVLAFVLPQHDPEPRDVPIAVLAPAARDIQERLGDAVDVRTVASPAAARELIEAREVVGAVLGERVLIASGASPAAAQLLQQTAAATPGGRATAVEDLAPFDENDSRGTTLNALMLPLVIACLPFSLLLWRSVRSRSATLVAALSFAALGGLSVAAIAQVVVDALAGNYFAVAGVLALAVAAITLPAVAGLRLAGFAGFGAAAFVFFLIGNPASGAATGVEFLPSPWRELSGLLPPGAAVDALRSMVWFDGAGSAKGLIVLAIWAVLGTALVLLPERTGKLAPGSPSGA